MESSESDRARELAARALARRDVSVSSLKKRLDAGGVERDEIDRVVEALVRAGLVDDVRLARELSSSLADRGLGDEAILARLEAEGIGPEEGAYALTMLEPEESRAVGVAERESARGPRRLAALLARRGFGEDAVEAALVSFDGRTRPKVP